MGALPKRRSLGFGFQQHGCKILKVSSLTQTHTLTEMSPGGGSLNGCLAVAGFAAALYLNSLNGEFVFDDHEAIETNVDVRYPGKRYCSLFTRFMTLHEAVYPSSPCTEQTRFSRKCLPMTSGGSLYQIQSLTSRTVLWSSSASELTDSSTDCGHLASIWSTLYCMQL